MVNPVKMIVSIVYDELNLLCNSSRYGTALGVRYLSKKYTWEDTFHLLAKGDE